MGLENRAPPPYTSSSASPPLTGSPVSTGTESRSASPQLPASPPEYSARKRVVLWKAEGGRQARRARDFTHDLAPVTVTKRFSLDGQNITHVRHGDQGCSLIPRPLGGYSLRGQIEMWSEDQRIQEYHWGGQDSGHGMAWRLEKATDGSHIRRDANTVADILPHQRVHASRVLAGAREVRTGKPDRDLRAALTANGGVAAWNVASAAYAAEADGDHHTYLSRLPGFDPEAAPSFKVLDKADEGINWARWATAEVGASTSPRRQRHARNVLDFDVGSVVVALKEDGEVWVCSKDLEWRLLCVVDRPENVNVVARGHVVGLYRVPSDDEEEPTPNQPVAYVVDLQAGVRVYPIQSGGEGDLFVQLSLQPLTDGYQAAARTRSGEVHAWMCAGSSPRTLKLRMPGTPSSMDASGSRPASRDSQPSTWTCSGQEESLGFRPHANKPDVSICAPQVTELVELPHTRHAQLFPVSVGVGCGLCVVVDEPGKKRRGIMGLGLLAKGKGKKVA
ncbi:hypothetical protein CspeluHIS016_0700490 [Cutaneotrichosporon spelunceum]|uniref:Uncharacterized protein n=1 Tax=Cutaneotrichosporon spelunceum TaxID=1672016 RepID=A0AAD3YEH8_9TREE|nr:hypothetical protein CspeluHIS016_0700490 [Cutaneotrichosporon spelunceum]